MVSGIFLYAKTKKSDIEIKDWYEKFREDYTGDIELEFEDEIAQSDNDTENEEFVSAKKKTIFGNMAPSIFSKV